MTIAIVKGGIVPSRIQALGIGLAPERDADVLKALAQLENKSPEDVLTEVTAQAVKARMKQAVSEL